MLHGVPTKCCASSMSAMEHVWDHVSQARAFMNTIIDGVLWPLPLPPRRYWLQNTTQNGLVGQPETPAAAAMVYNSSSPLDGKYQHFTTYDNSATKYCVAASPRQAFYSYKHKLVSSAGLDLLNDAASQPASQLPTFELSGALGAGHAGAMAAPEVT